MASDLKKKTVKGFTWNLLERFGVYGMNFILGVILARILMPKDYGLISMVGVFAAIAGVFVSGGLGAAYIQKKEVNDDDANSVFFANLGISILMYFILWFAAPLISRFFEQPLLVDLTRVMGITLLIQAATIVQQSKVTRDLNFKKNAIIQLVASAVSGTIAIIAAFKGMGVWSLVIKGMGQTFLVSLGFWLNSRWMPKPQLSITSLKGLFHFGGWILASNILRTFFDNIYTLVIGKFFPVAELGFYTKAKSYQELSSQRLAQTISLVSFPALSQMQHDKHRLKNAVRKFLAVSVFFITPIMALLIVLAEPFVILLLTEKWAPIIPYLQLLCVVGLLYPIHSLNVSVLLAQGKSNLNFNLAMLKNGFRILNIIVMYRFGVMYIILGEVVLSFIALAINTYYTKKLIEYGLFAQLREISVILIGGIFAGLVTFVFSFFVTNLWVLLFAGSFILIGSYLVYHFIFNREFLIETINLKNNFLKNS